MLNKMTKLNDQEIEDAIKEIKKLKDEKNISWTYVFKHYPDTGSSSASALNKAVNKRSVIVNYEGLLKFLRNAKCQERGRKVDKQVRQEWAAAIAKRKDELGITYDEMFFFYKGHGKITKGNFIEQVRRGYGKYLVDLIKWLNDLTLEDLELLRAPSREEAEKRKAQLEENKKCVCEIKEIKEKYNLSIAFIFDNTNHGCKTPYALTKAMKTADKANFRAIAEDLKSLDVEKIKARKKVKKEKPKQYKNRYGRPFEGRRLVRVYAKENGLFGLQREYLE